MQKEVVSTFDVYTFDSLHIFVGIVLTAVELLEVKCFLVSTACLICLECTQLLK